MNSVEKTIKLIAESKTGGTVDGVVVDAFTATMINTVASKLNEENKQKFYSMPLNKMVAMSYKVMIESTKKNG